MLDCGPYVDRSGLSSRLQAELDEALLFLNDCNIPFSREDRDPTFISKQVRPKTFLILVLVQKMRNEQLFVVLEQMIGLIVMKVLLK